MNKVVVMMAVAGMIAVAAGAAQELALAMVMVTGRRNNSLLRGRGDFMVLNLRVS